MGAGLHATGLIADAEGEGFLVDGALAFVIDDGGETALTQTVFTDDFNRPDGAVGNGWSPLIGQTGQAMVIEDGALVIPLPEPGPITFSGVYRPLAIDNPTTLSCDITESNGFGGLNDRYFYQFLIGSDGAAGHGYGIQVYRGDQNYNNSSIILVQDNTTIATLFSTFQFSETLHLEVTFNPDGSITGTISQPGSSFDFAFDPYAFTATGENLVICGYDLDNTGGPYIEPTFDNLVITVETDEPGVIAVEDEYSLRIGQTLQSRPGRGVLINDVDVDSDGHLAVTAVNGVAADVGQAVQGQYGILTLNADGSFTYVAASSAPPRGAIDVFSYTVSDGIGGEATTVVEFTVLQGQPRPRTGGGDAAAVAAILAEPDVHAVPWHALGAADGYFV